MRPISLWAGSPSKSPTACAASTSQTFTPHVDTGDFVVVVNARKVKLTGRKDEQKVYVNFSGFRGGRKVIKAAVVRERNPERMVYDAVRRMLPKNRLMRTVFQRLKVYPEAEHPHVGQPLQPLA